ncbi:adenylosuccinate lyase [bacterium]|nr:adenylosuccinate lyase [bacterium]
MIPRYEDKKIKSIWSQNNRIKKFIRIEAGLLKYYESICYVKKNTYKKILAAKVTAKEVDARERITKHDIIAFLEVLEKKSGVSKGLHMGLTSSDILDTATGLQIKETRKYIEKILKNLKNVLWEKANEYKTLPILGRTHNITAQPMTLGLKILNWFVEFERSNDYFIRVMKDGECGMISGPVGTYENVAPKTEDFILNNLGLKKAHATNQIIQRDIYARIISEGSILASVIERIATQIRLLSHMEINEINEPFSKGQKGSSAMPHKKNPIRSERISGLSRLVRGFTQSAMENIILWHERDISNSSLERIIIPDFFHTLVFIAKELTAIMSDIVVRKDDIKRNIKSANEIYYSGVLLVELMKRGQKRKGAYELIQPLVFESIEKRRPFSRIVMADKKMVKIFGEKDLKAIFHIGFFLKYVNEVFQEAKGRQLKVENGELKENTRKKKWNKHRAPEHKQGKKKGKNERYKK